jgi:hypothetical protein
MALTHLVTPHAKRRHVAAAPPAVRLTVLRAVNAPLANELEALEADPIQAMTRMRKLDAETAIEIAGLMTSPVALRAILQDQRDSVTYAVRVRASDLGIDLSATEVTQPTPRQVNASTETRTARVLAKPINEAITALAKMATIDEAAVLAWVHTLDESAPWAEIVAATNRHWGLARSVITDALVREAVNVDAYLATGDLQTITTAASAHEGELNATMVAVLNQAVIRDHPVHEVKATSISREALAALKTAALPIKMMCDVATPQEVVAAFNTWPPPSSRPADAYEQFSLLYSNVRSAEVAEAITPLIGSLEPLMGYLYSRFSANAAEHLLKLPNIGHDTVRQLWAHSGASMQEVLRGSYGPVPSQDDLTWLIERYGDAEDAKFDVSIILSAISYSERSDMGDQFTNRILHEMPGGAAALLRTNMRWREDWMSSIVLEYATGKLQDNVSAWRVFLSEAESYTGLFEELLNAAVVATA